MRRRLGDKLTQLSDVALVDFLGLADYVQPIPQLISATIFEGRSSVLPRCIIELKWGSSPACHQIGPDMARGRCFYSSKIVPRAGQHTADLTDAEGAIFNDLASGGTAKNHSLQFIRCPRKYSGGKPENAMNFRA